MPSTIYELELRYHKEHGARFVKMHLNSAVWNGRFHRPKFNYGPVAQTFIKRAKGRARKVHNQLMRLDMNARVYYKHHIEI